MKELFNKYGIQISDEKIEKLNVFYTLLTEYNKKFNLTNITEYNEVITKHFIDSISGYKLITGKTVIDIGAGGGFPSIPLKIYLPEIELTMLDATEKKCEFLKTVVKELNLSNCKVVCARAEELAFNKEYREKFDISVSRAVAKLNVLCEYDLPFVKKGGKLIAYKGDAEEEIKEGLNAIKIMGGKLCNTLSFELEGAKRTLIEIEKIEKTGEKYPRTNAKIRKNPL